MLVSDILKSCRHRAVAEAAIASIGGDFAADVRWRADASGQSIGDFTASQVTRFSERASERDWRYLLSTMHGEDLALLAGLQAVMLRMMAEAGSSSTSSAERRSAA